MERIIYPEQDGVSIIIPAPNLTVSGAETAAKLVPNGVPFRIVDHTDLPTTREFRDAWEADFTKPDGVGA